MRCRGLVTVIHGPTRGTDADQCAAVALACCPCSPCGPQVFKRAKSVPNIRKEMQFQVEARMQRVLARTGEGVGYGSSHSCPLPRWCATPLCLSAHMSLLVARTVRRLHVSRAACTVRRLSSLPSNTEAMVISSTTDAPQPARRRCLQAAARPPLVAHTRCSPAHPNPWSRAAPFFGGRCAGRGEGYRTEDRVEVESRRLQPLLRDGEARPHLGAAHRRSGRQAHCRAGRPLPPALPALPCLAAAATPSAVSR